jgi:hemin uptake protein HemP
MTTSGHAIAAGNQATATAPDETLVRPANARRMTSTRELLGGGNEVQIEHNGEIYTLRQTSKGKLILTK